MKITATSLKRTALTVLLIVGIALAFRHFIGENAARISRQNEEYIHELTSQRAESIDTLIAENLSYIHSTAFLYGKNLTSAFADIALIRDYEENTAFDMLRFVDEAGDNYTSKGLAANLSDRPYFQAGIRGESGVTYVARSRVTGERQIGFYAPVYFEGRIVGVMVGFYGEDFIRGLLEYNLFENEGEAWLCLADGTVLGTTVEAETENFFDYMSENGRISTEEIESLREDVTSRRTEIFRFREGNNETTGSAVLLRNADWVLVRSFPQEAAERISRNANSAGLSLVGSLLALFLLYGLILALDAYRNHRRLVEQNRDANYITNGVSELFSSFTLIDLEEGSGRVLAGTGAGGADAQGAYEELCALMIAQLADEEERQAAEAFLKKEHLQEILAEKDVTSVRMKAAGGKCYTCNFVVLERKEGVPVKLLSIAQDVTALYEREEADRKKLRAALSESERASRAKTEFLFNMSHDLRTPMNAIIGYTELARREGTKEEEMAGYIRKINTSSHHLLALINDILEMSRIESGKMTIEPEPGDLLATLEEAREMFSSQMAEKEIRFTLDTEGVRDRYVSFDESRLNRVILNLLSNAWKFTPKGGTVEMRLLEPERTEEDGLFELHVKDSGIGISPEFMEKLFAPFERERTSTVSKTQGTGLGLSITKNIVELMNGTIACESTPGAGTEFIIRLRFPRAERPEAGEQTEESAVREVDYTKLRILLVEDIEINREIASMVLLEKGCQLETAENGQIAVDLVKNAAPGHFDLILMDVQMPVMDGYTATKEIRALPDAQKAAVPIIAMTANAFKEDVEAALDAGMNGHIAKPLDMNRMFETIASVLP